MTSPDASPQLLSSDARTLRTPRLVGTPVEPADLGFLAGMWADAEVASTLGGTRTTRESHDALDRSIAQWAAHGHGRWLLRTAGSSQPVGYVKLERRTLGSVEVVELGYALERRAWGNGYATEAAAAALSWGWSHVPTDLIVAVILENNVSSINVVQRLGMTPRGTVGLAAGTHNLYELCRSPTSVR